MLDEPLIGKELKFLRLKCPICGIEFNADIPEEEADVENIDETGFCVECANENFECIV